MSIEMYALVELMGHSKIAGKISEENIAGTPMLRVDVPTTSHSVAFTKYYSPAAVYAISPIEESVMQQMAESFGERPVSIWRLTQITTPQLSERVLPNGIGSDEPDDDYFNDEDDWP